MKAFHPKNNHQVRKLIKIWKNTRILKSQHDHVSADNDPVRVEHPFHHEHH